ncbi:doublesex and mab-3 related transcription factor 3, truncated-like [Pollicipes pollicipes]|uniref:doublesex and mab-3 related transcription factor 3, truncated-like n=1 Tax=Pollicipes pollicipes TaxID=41117 RepID=UPI0018851043|nr:doublesex and mab-3 related transcription factor 3, truncated-like [Pollicipes pollicipes]
MESGDGVNTAVTEERRRRAKAGVFSPYPFRVDGRRLPTCIACKNHGLVMLTRGHRSRCPFKRCCCVQCSRHHAKNNKRLATKQASLQRQGRQQRASPRERASPDSSCRDRVPPAPRAHLPVKIQPAVSVGSVADEPAVRDDSESESRAARVQARVEPPMDLSAALKQDSSRPPHTDTSHNLYNWLSAQIDAAAYPTYDFDVVAAEEGGSPLAPLDFSAFSRPAEFTAPASVWGGLAGYQASQDDFASTLRSWPTTPSPWPVDDGGGATSPLGVRETGRQYLAYQQYAQTSVSGWPAQANSSTGAEKIGVADEMGARLDVCCTQTTAIDSQAAAAEPAMELTEPA